MTKRRAVFLINSLTGGGAERVMCTLLRHSSAERDEFDITLGLLDNEPAAYQPPDWVDVRQFDCNFSFARSVAAVRRLYSEVKPDVTLSFLTRANMANVLNAPRACVISERANTSAHFPRDARGLVQRAMVRVLYPRATRVIAVSEGVAEDLRCNFGVRADRVVAIPNPIDLAVIEEKARQAPEVAIDGPYILAAGRLVKSKNFDMLVRAFAASAVDGKLVIVGEGPEREALTAVATELGVQDRVLLPGFVKNPYPLMRGATLFVLCSNAEGFPNALVEAMAVGAPVIAANCASGPSEILAEVPRENLNGITFAPYGVVVPTNDVDAMTEALRAMTDSDRRSQYAGKAAARARTFGAGVAKDRYWDVLRAAMKATA